MLRTPVDLLRRARDVLYPSRCIGCGAFDSLICERCAAALARGRIGGEGRCANCASEWREPGFCTRCEWWGWESLDGCRAAYDLEGVPRRLVHALKYEGVRDAAPVMARQMAGMWDASRFDVAVAVPLHVSRERTRGFNQSELLLGQLGWPLMEGRLERILKTAPQVGQRQENRRRQMAGAFRYTGPGLQGVRVVLVDDVVTSGATARECALELKAAGARTVTVAAFGRARFRADALAGNLHIRD